MRCEISMRSTYAIELDRRCCRSVRISRPVKIRPLSSNTSRSSTRLKAQSSCRPKAAATESVMYRFTSVMFFDRVTGLSVSCYGLRSRISDVQLETESRHSSLRWSLSPRACCSPVRRQPDENFSQEFRETAATALEVPHKSIGGASCSVSCE
jgi:hypothetical protein